MFKKIINSEKIKPDEILFVGNSIEDYYASNEMKINFIYFQNSYLPKLQRKKILIVRNMLQLNNMINTILSKEK